MTTRTISHSTQAQRNPLTWSVTTKHRGYLYVARNLITGALMEVMMLREGFRVFSHGSESTYEVDGLLGCGCPSFEESGGFCKHAAACSAVERHAERDAVTTQAERKQRAHAEIAALGL